MKRFSVLVAALGLAAAALADPVAPAPLTRTDPAPTAARPAHYLAADAVDVRALVPPPPAPDSLVQRAEIEVLLHLQAERTPAQVARARLVDAEDAFGFGSDVLGEWFKPANLPAATAFFAGLAADLTGFNRAGKSLFNRRRPPFLDARIKPCVEFADTGAYPSGHAMRSALWAGLFAAVFPDQAAAFRDRASETRWCRLLAGVHSPSDVEAGRIVGEALARELLKKTAVRQALEAIRAEVAPFRLKKAA